jgi:hypothetical protein
MLASVEDGIPHLRVWQRVWRHPNARIQPLGAKTVYQASSARVWVDGAIAAHLQRLEGRWELSALGKDPSPKIYGSTALEAVSNWLLSDVESQS